MLAKRDYYIKTFSKYSKNLRMTWNAINETLNRHKSKRRFPAEFKLANGKIYCICMLATGLGACSQELDTMKH